MDVVAARDVARRKLGVADHIVTHTYPLVKDPKLLIAALQNVHDAVDAGLQAMLQATPKKLPPIPDRFEARLTAFQLHLVPSVRPPAGFFRFVGELEETLREHRSSPVEFVRRSALIICDKGYRVRMLTAEQMRRYVAHAEAFITMVEASA
jgi:hypothetical protein